MKTSKVLKLALRELHKVYDNSYDELYICWILEHLCYTGRITPFDAQRVKGLFHRLLDGKVSLEHWLQVKGHAKRYMFNIYDHHSKPIPDKRDALRRKLYVTRQAWLDHLIKYYQAKGD